MDTTVDSGASSDATLFASGSSRDRWHVARATSGLLIGLVRTVSLALNLATAGWAAPMTKGLYLQLVCARLTIDGRKLRYDGSLLGVAVVWSRIWALSLVTLGVYYWLHGRGALYDYLDSRLGWADEPAPPIETRLLDDVKAFVSVSNRPQTWRVLSAGGGLLATVVDLIGRLFVLLTLGLAFPWVEDARLRRWADGVVIDGRRVRYSGSGAGLAMVWLKTWALTWLTLSLYWWWKGRTAIHTYFDERLDWAPASRPLEPPAQDT